MPESAEIDVRGVLVSKGKGSWTRLLLSRPSSVRLGARGKVRVAGTIDGRPFKTVAIPNGDGTHALLFTKEVQAATSTSPGDRVRARLRVLAGPKPVRVPAELARLLARDRAAAAALRGLPPSYRRAWCECVASAQREATRRRRAESAVRRLGAGERDPRRQRRG